MNLKLVNYYQVYFFKKMGKLDEILLKEIKLKKLGVSEITIVAIKKEKYLSNLYYWDCFKSSYKNFKI